MQLPGEDSRVGGGGRRLEAGGGVVRRYIIAEIEKSFHFISGNVC